MAEWWQQTEEQRRRAFRDAGLTPEQIAGVKAGKGYTPSSKSRSSSKSSSSSSSISNDLKQRIDNEFKWIQQTALNILKKNNVYTPEVYSKFLSLQEKTKQEAYERAKTNPDEFLNSDYTYVVVKPGDTANEIAQSYGYSNWKEAGISVPSGDPDKIYVGDVIRIKTSSPSYSPVVSAQPAREEVNKIKTEINQLSEQMSTTPVTQPLLNPNDELDKLLETYQPEADIEKTMQRWRGFDINSFFTDTNSENLSQDYDNQDGIAQIPMQRPTELQVAQIQDPKFQQIIAEQEETINGLKQLVSRLNQVMQQDLDMHPQVQALKQQLQQEVELVREQAKLQTRAAMYDLYRIGGYRFQVASANAVQNQINQQLADKIATLNSKYQLQISKAKEAIREENYRKLLDAYKELRNARKDLRATIKDAVDLKSKALSQAKTQLDIYKTQFNLLEKQATSNAQYLANLALETGRIPDQTTLRQYNVPFDMFLYYFKDLQNKRLKEQASIQNILSQIQKREADSVRAAELHKYNIALKQSQLQLNKAKLQKTYREIQKLRRSGVSVNDIYADLLLKYKLPAENIRKLQLIDKNGIIAAAIYATIDSVNNQYSDPQMREIIVNQTIQKFANEATSGLLKDIARSEEEAKKDAEGFWSKVSDVIANIPAGIAKLSSIHLAPLGVRDEVLEDLGQPMWETSAQRQAKIKDNIVNALADRIGVKNKRDFTSKIKSILNNQDLDENTRNTFLQHTIENALRETGMYSADALYQGEINNIMEQIKTLSTPSSSSSLNLETMINMIKNNKNNKK